MNYCEAGASRADAILGQVSKGISRAWEGITSLLDTGFLRDLMDSVSMLILKHPEKMQKKWNSSTKTTGKSICSPANSASQ